MAEPLKELTQSERLDRALAAVRRLGESMRLREALARLRPGSCGDLEKCCREHNDAFKGHAMWLAGEIEAGVEWWHSASAPSGVANGDGTLAEFLGMGALDYEAWVRDGTVRQSLLTTEASRIEWACRTRHGGGRAGGSPRGRGDQGSTECRPTNQQGLTASAGVTRKV